MEQIDRLHGILVFLRVVELGSLSAGARALGVSAAAVSAAVARLERKLAVRLLNRTTRRLSVTAEGAEFYARCKQIAADLEEASLVAGRAGRVPSGRLRVGMPATLGRLWIVPRMKQFMRKYPSIGPIETVFSNYVPYAMDQDLDASVEVGELPPSRLAVKRLASTHYVVCAAPSYVAECGVPRSPEELLSHTCLTYRRPRNGRIREWRFRSGDSMRHIPINGAMTFNSGEALVAAAAAGHGIIQVAEYYARAQLEAGTLVGLLEDYKTEGYDISVVYHSSRRMSPKVKVFVDFLAEIFDKEPWKRTGPR